MVIKGEAMQFFPIFAQDKSVMRKTITICAHTIRDKKFYLGSNDNNFINITN